MDAPGGQAVKSIGRTPDNDIHVPHPQVSSRHAALHFVGRANLPRRQEQRQRHLRARSAHRARAARPRQQRREGLHRPDAALDPGRGSRGRGRRRRRRQLGRPPALRDRGLGPADAGARSRQPGRAEDAARPRQLQGLARRLHRPDGPERRRQDDAADDAQRLFAAQRRPGAHQRRRPVRHLRRAARLDRLRAAGRHRAPRAHGVRSRALQRALPPAARLLGRRDQPARRHHARPSSAWSRSRTCRSASPSARSCPAVSASASTSPWSW